MKEKLDKNISQWEKEKKVLEKISKNLKEYIKLKDDKAEKALLEEGSAKMEKIFDENPWVDFDWKEIKRSKMSRSDGLQKIKEKLDARKEKIAEGNDELNKIINPERDWSDEIANCGIGQQYFHWAYGQMEVVEENGNYIYLKLKDKKGCKSQWLDKNGITKDINGKVQEVREFSKKSIGKFLFPKLEDVKIIDKETAHKNVLNQK